jgi:hypothetical protein
MTEQAHPEDVQQLVRLLARGRVAELARTSGVNPSSIYRCLAGKAIPRAGTLQKLVAGAGLSPRFVEALLLPAIRAARLARTPLSESFLEDFEAAAEELAGELGAAALIQVGLFLAQLEDPAEWWERNDLPADEAGRRAADLRSRLEPLSAEDRRFLVETCPEYRIRSLAALPGNASVSLDT